jgi:mRNA interferase MazF
MKRGDIYWFKFREPDKRRPVVILTRDPAIPYLNALVVAATTSTIHRTPSEVVIGPEDGMPAVCAVNLHRLHYAHKDRFEKWITRLSPERMSRIREAVLYTLQLNEPE